MSASVPTKGRDEAAVTQAVERLQFDARITAPEWVRVKSEHLRTVLQALRDVREERDRIKAENYTDLLDQMDEAWGSAREIGRAELTAFLESRIVHKPTKTLREERDALKAEALQLKGEIVQAAIRKSKMRLR